MTDLDARTRRGRDPVDLILLLALGVLWGGAFLAIKIAIPHIPPLTQAAARTLIAALLLVGFLAWRGTSMPLDWGSWRNFAIMGFLGAAAPFTLIAFGEIRVDASLAAILTGAAPIFAVGLSHLFSSDERLTWRRGGGVMLGFAGIMILFGPQAWAEGSGETMGQLAIIAAALCYAAAAVFGHRLRHVKVSVLSTGTMIASAAMLLPAALIFEAPWTLRPSAGAVAAIIVLGSVMTGLATLMFFRVLASAGANFAAQVNFLAPAAGVIGGVVLLGEVLAPVAIAALVLILLGVAVVHSAPLSDP